MHDLGVPQPVSSLRVADLLHIEAERNFLLSGDGKPKTCLASIGAQLLSDFTELKQTWRERKNTSAGRVQLAALYNLAALAQCRYGRLDRAESLSRKLIADYQKLASRTGCRDWAVDALQSYINIARLRGMRGDCNGCMEILRHVFLLVTGQDALTLDGFDLRSSDLGSHSLAEGEYAQVGRVVYVMDGMRAHLQAKSYRGLLEFIDTLRRDKQSIDAHWNELAILEASARALAGISEYNQALARAKELLENISAMGKHLPTMYLLPVMIYTQCGMLEDAHKILNFAATYTDRCYRREPASFRKFQAFLLLALNQCRLSLMPDAAESAVTALETARAIGHQPGVLRSLTLMAELPTADHNLQVGPELDAAISTSHYNFERGLALLASANGQTDDHFSIRRMTEAVAIVAEVKTCEAQHCWELLTEDMPEIISALPQRSAFRVAQSLEQLFEQLMGFEPEQAWSCISFTPELPNSRLH